LLYITILLVGCKSSGIAPTATQEEPLPEDIGITSFFFSVNPTTIVQGQCAVVRWGVEPEGEWPVVFNNENVQHVDQREVCPDRTHEYELWADPPGPDIHEEIITLEVIQPGSGDVAYEGEGEIIRFDADRDRILLGECVDLVWEALAPPDLYFILNGEPVPASGARRVCPAADTVYELLLLEPDEAVYAHISVYVDQGGEPPVGSTPSGAPPTGTETATPESQAPAEATASATPQPQAPGAPTATRTSTPTTTPQPQGPGAPTATRTPAPTETQSAVATSPVPIATFTWPTATQTLAPIPFPEQYLQVVDVFLVNNPIGEVNVRIRNAGPYQVNASPNNTVMLTCSTTIYARDHAPVAYSGNIRPNISLGPGQQGTYPGFYQGSGVNSLLDFTNGWGDVSCYLTLLFDGTKFGHYTERLP
jgi:hypothetical protein